MNKSFFIGGFTALVFCASATAQNPKLNAPVSRQPTVGSEIMRGEEAGFHCGLDYIMNFSKFVDCVNDVLRSNRQKGTLSEAYEFGVYIRALQHSYVHGIALNSEGGMLSVWRDRLMKIMKSSKLSFADFCDVVGEGKCDTTKINEQTYGSGTASGKR